MLEKNEIEQIIKLIHKGFSTQLLALELEIPIDQVESCYQQLELRKFAKQSIKDGTIPEAIKRLSNFIESSDYNIVERTILLKLQAYTNGENIDEELKRLEDERRLTGLSKDINTLLETLEIQIPKKKNSNIRKKEKSSQSNDDSEIFDNIDCQQETAKTSRDYEQAILKYKDEIAKNPHKSLNKRNILAFAYFKSGRIEEARDELMSLVDEKSSYMAYRQLIHLEKSQGNFDDARLWAEACLEQFSDNIDVRHQLVSIAIEEGNNSEAIKQLKRIISISPENSRAQITLKSIESESER